MEPSLPSAPPLPHSPPTAGSPWSTVDCPRSTACPPRYRPRQPRASPVWQVVRDHWPAFRAAYPGRYQADWGPLPDRADTAVSAFLRCGDFNAGFEQPPQRWPSEGEAAQLTFFADDEAQSFPPDDDVATRSAAWGNFARLRLAPQRPQAQSIDDDFAQSFPPDDLPALVYD